MTAPLAPEAVTRDEFDAAMSRAREDIATVIAYAKGNLTEEDREKIRAWAEFVLDASGARRIVYEREVVDPARAPTTEPMLALDGEPEASFEDRGDRVLLSFEVSRAQFWALVDAGRTEMRNAGVVYPMGPWSDETCARSAVRVAMTQTFPEIVGLPRVGDPDDREAVRA